MSSFYGNVGIGDGSSGGGSSIDDGSYVQIAGDIMTGPLGTTELTVGSRGTGSVGEKSFTSGYNNVASNSNTSAEGYQTVASGSCAHSEGHQTTASGDDSHAEGRKTVASGQYAHAEGSYTQATGDHAHAEGSSGSVAAGIGSHAEGGATEAIGNYSHAEGNNTHAIGWSSHAEGTTSIASGSCSHAEGQHTTASGANSHAEGSETIAASANQHVNGKFNVIDSSNTYAEIVGNGTSGSDRSNAYTLDWNGNATYAGRVTAGTNPVNSMDLTTKLYVDNLITNMSGETTYSVELSENEVRIPLNFGQVDYLYQSGQMIGSSIVFPGGRERSSASATPGTPGNPDSYVTDPSEPNKIYKNPNLPETPSWITPFGLLYKTYHGNKIVPGYLQSMRIVYSAEGPIAANTAPFVEDVFIRGSWFDNDLENITTNQDGWVGWFSGFAYFVTPEELQEAMAGQSSSQSEQASPVRTDISPFLDEYLYATKQERQAFLILELTFNIEGHLVTKILPIYFINNHQPVQVRPKQSNNYSISIRPYPNTSYYIKGEEVAALQIVPMYQGKATTIPLPFEVIFDTPSSNSAVTTFDEENFHLPSSSNLYHIPEWFQLYPGTRYDISYDIMGNMTFASWDISSKGWK